jgi:hypothetical protein
VKSEKIAFYFSTLVVGPLLGSFITEPAAMTVTALILKEYFYDRKHMSKAFMYATLGLLFVNISVGGSLTAFAAPPILMAAQTLNWDSWFVFTHIGWKAILSIIVSTSLVLAIFRKELVGKFRFVHDEHESDHPNSFVTIVHLAFLILVIILAKYMNFFMMIFIFFIGFTVISKVYQEKRGLHFSDSIYVAFFLGGILTLGAGQEWWLKLVLTKMGNVSIYLGTAFLTMFTDNSALTFLGSHVDLVSGAHLRLVSAAIAGGGMTIIANAPNPAGYGILKNSFGTGVDPIKIFLGAAIPTLITLLFLYY